MSFAKPEKHEVQEGNYPLPCRGCGDLTPRATLSSCGAWCFPCFASYCRDRPVQRPYVESQTVREMKTRLKGRLSSPELERLAA